MKSIKRILALLLVVLMAMSLAACKESDKESPKSDAELIIGKWNLDLYSFGEAAGSSKEEVQELIAMGYSYVTEFTKDGKMINTTTEYGEVEDDAHENILYYIQDGKLFVQFERNDIATYDYEISKDELKVIKDGVAIRYTRAK